MECTETQKTTSVKKQNKKKKPITPVEELTIAELLQGSDGRERGHADLALLQLLHWLSLLQEVLVKLSLQRCQPETVRALQSPCPQTNTSPPPSTQWLHFSSSTPS